jgi:hypothetical protein
MVERVRAAVAEVQWRSGHGFDDKKRSGGWHACALVVAAFVLTSATPAMARSIQFLVLASSPR